MTIKYELPYIKVKDKNDLQEKIFRFLRDHVFKSIIPTSEAIIYFWHSDNDPKPLIDKFISEEIIDVSKFNVYLEKEVEKLKKEKNIKTIEEELSLYKDLFKTNCLLLNTQSFQWHVESYATNILHSYELEQAQKKSTKK